MKRFWIYLAASGVFWILAGRAYVVGLGAIEEYCATPAEGTSTVAPVCYALTTEFYIGLFAAMLLTDLIRLSLMFFASRRNIIVKEEV